jgi:hypothetical protein
MVYFEDITFRHTYRDYSILIILIKNSNTLKTTKEIVNYFSLL